MNDRIRELADQAELTIRTSIGTYMSHPEFNKKFAELIVRECANIASNPAPGCHSSFGKIILEHFELKNE